MTEVATPIDWTRRASPTDGPTATPFEIVGTHGGNWAIVPRVPGEILTAAKYNADRQAAVDNDTPLSIDDYSATLAEMQAETNPYPGGSISQATSLAGELERIRWCLHQLNPSASAWYAVPFEGVFLGSGEFASLHVTGNLTVDNEVRANQFIVPNNRPYSTYFANGTTIQNLIFMGTDDNVYVGWGTPAAIVLGSGANVRAAGVFEALFGISVIGQLVMQKGQWIYWSDINGIMVDATNRMEVGLNCTLVYVHPDMYIDGTLGLPKDKSIFFGTSLAVTVDGANNMGLGQGCAQVVIYPPTSLLSSLYVNGNVTLQKGAWLMASERGMLAVATADNSLYVGSLSPGAAVTAIRLNAETRVEGALVTAGDITAGASGSGAVYGRNLPKAWGRAKMPDPPQFLAGHNIISMQKLAVGTMRFTLAANVPAWSIALATVEHHPDYPLVANVVWQTATIFDVVVRSSTTGLAADWYLDVAMF